MSTPTKVYDLYATVLNYKEDVTILNRPWVTLSWIPDDHARRLKAYEIFASYYLNYSRDYRQDAESGTTDNDIVAEMGDPSWFCDKIRDKVLGDEVKPIVPMPRSVRNLRTMERLLEQGEGEQGLSQRIEETKALSEKLKMQEAYIQEWFDDYNIALKVYENESTCSYLGDMVYIVKWDSDNKVPIIDTYDPGFVFPFYDINEKSLQQDTDNIVKDRVYVGWELETDSDTDFEVWRDIYELRFVGEDMQCWRKYGKYRFSGSADTELEYFDDLDMIEHSGQDWHNTGLDFIPIVMIPNIKLTGYDFGASNLLWHINTFDAIQNTDTDMRNNGEKLGGAIVAVSGKDVKQKRDSTNTLNADVELEPNSVFVLGENGRMDLVDTSSMQDALMKTSNEWLRKLIKNSNITEVGAGIIDVNDISGTALSILLRPLIDKIKPMRTSRQRYYSEVFWRVLRMWQIYGNQEERSLFSDKLYDVVLSFGAIIPKNENEDAEKYTALLPIFGRETVLEMAQRDGYDIDVETVMERVAKEEQKALQSQLSAFGGRIIDENQNAD